MKNAEQIALVKAALENMDDNALISAWNEYVSGDDQIYENDEEFFEMCFTKPIDAVRAVAFGDYRYTDSYVRFDGYANLESFNCLSDKIDFDELADYVWENRLDCIDWDEIEEEVGDEFRGWMKENGVSEEVAEKFMDEEFDWENEFTEMIEEVLQMETEEEESEDE